MKMTVFSLVLKLILLLGRVKRIKMGKLLRYCVFRTRWGWFGLYGSEKGLIRTCLPTSNKKNVPDHLLKRIDSPAEDSSFFQPLQEMIKSYFEGSYVDFRRISVCLDGLTDFQKKVLLNLHTVKYGELTTYKDLASSSGKPTAFRAIGQVMARNPLPLIIPCHRVVRKDGLPGGFSAEGGVNMKKKMQALESATVGEIEA